MPLYKGPTIGAPSKATPSTQCQKCLRRGHYTYECKTSTQERPYISRPSRTQQLFNPKLVPELHTDVPADLLRKKGVADEELARKEREREKAKEREREGRRSKNGRGRKRERSYEDLDRPEERRKRQRSRSTASSVSVSTISTNLSRSRSPSRRRSPSPRRSTRHSAAQPIRPDERGARRGRRDSRSASPASYSSRSRSRSRSPYRAGRKAEPRIRKSTRSLSRSRSPPSYESRIRGGRPDRDRGEYRDRRESYRPGNGDARDAPALVQPVPKAAPSGPAPPRERSLSPFSKRVALTKQMGER